METKKKVYSDYSQKHLFWNQIVGFSAFWWEWYQVIVIPCDSDILWQWYLLTMISSESDILRQWYLLRAISSDSDISHSDIKSQWYLDTMISRQSDFKSQFLQQNPGYSRISQAWISSYFRNGSSSVPRRPPRTRTSSLQRSYSTFSFTFI